jgi:BirA family transcriptional regulator, biotin operon repressor / biotin---[acetyl-CoA-carboxylase] ligase
MPGFVIERHGEVDSTMRVARSRAAAGAPSGTIVVAAAQTEGRGRRGRVWFSPPASGLWLTAILRPPPPPDDSPLYLLGTVTGVAVLRAVRELGCSAAQLKWPNDLVVGDRKLCGILLEGEGLGGPSPLVLAGVGLNLAASAELARLAPPMPAELADRYVGLCEATDGGQAAATYEEALAKVVRSLAAGYAEWLEQGATPALAAWRQADALLGSRVRAELGERQVLGQAQGISDSGALRVATGEGVVEISAGDVLRVRHDRPW